MILKDKTIAIDWDGTFVDDGHYPEFGEPKPHAVRVTKRILEEGGRILIWTCRGGLDQVTGISKVLWKNGIEDFIVNEHYPDITGQFEHSSQKVFADVYIDDRGIHSYGKEIDWLEVEKILFTNTTNNDIIKES
ncbi:hypothetical protein AB3N02_22720 [Priestia aryabhattai]|uniref:hypothetical protein n=1 Tax=Priestia aryabhattai TaxID=412384 RepID=UPI00399FE420